MTDESESPDTKVVQLFPKAELPEGNMVVNMSTVKTDVLIRMRDIEREASAGTADLATAAARVEFWRVWMLMIDKDPDMAMGEIWQAEVFMQDAMEWDEYGDDDE